MVTRNLHRFPIISLGKIRNLSVSDQDGMDHIPSCHFNVFIVTFGICFIYQSYSVPIMNFKIGTRHIQSRISIYCFDDLIHWNVTSLF